MSSPLSDCTLCPHRCHVDRAAGKLGWCHSGVNPRVFRYGPHFGEEPPLIGKNGSGAIFFSRCTMKCLYCQNSPWSWRGEGEDYTIEGLRNLFRGLATHDKCANWNLVSPTPWLPQIREAVFPLISAGIRLPFVYNTSGFESLETLEAFPELCDIALTDLRYAHNDTAKAASGVDGYVETARKALAWFWEKLGPLAVDADGVATRGVVCRILVLPGHADEAVENLAWLATKVSNGVHVSVMSQYTPSYQALDEAPWNRGVTEEEYSTVTEAAADFGFDNGWIQDFESAKPSDLLGEAMSAGAGTVGKAKK